MMKEIEKYVGKCFRINFESEKNMFCIFTIPTQRFYVESLSELTPERFEGEIKRQKRYEFNGIKPKQR
jgi:hypothetical protein